MIAYPRAARVGFFWWIFFCLVLGLGVFSVEVQFYPARSYTALVLLVAAMAAQEQAEQDSICYKNTSYLQGARHLCF